MSVKGGRSKVFEWSNEDERKYFRKYYTCKPFNSSLEAPLVYSSKNKKSLCYLMLFFIVLSIV